MKSSKNNIGLTDYRSVSTADYEITKFTLCVHPKFKTFRTKPNLSILSTTWEGSRKKSSPSLLG